jgi:hypothetical protein
LSRSENTKTKVLDLKQLQREEKTSESTKVTRHKSTAARWEGKPGNE